MTPSMRLSALQREFMREPIYRAVEKALERAFSLGHEFGLERAADEIDRRNHDGPYEAIAGAARIRSLRVEHVKAGAELTEPFSEVSA